MRTEAVPAEKLLWEKLRNKKLCNSKFRRQHPVGQFVVDFYCMEAKLVVEVDGPTHENNGEADVLRQEFLESIGLRVIRYSNADIYRRMNWVLSEIAGALKPHP